MKPAQLSIAPLLLALSPLSAEMLLNFDTATRSEIGLITDDGVMGGLSKGKLTLESAGIVRFHGNLSLQNNGGFSSWTISENERDLSAWKGIELKVRGDGRSYKLRLQTDEKYRFSRVSFQASFATQKNEWTTVRVPFADLAASWRGRDLERRFDPAKVSCLGIILADKVEGAFTLEVDEIGLWK